MELNNSDIFLGIFIFLIIIFEYLKHKLNFWARNGLVQFLPKLTHCLNKVKYFEYIHWQLKIDGYKHGGVYYYLKPVYVPIGVEFVNNIFKYSEHFVKNKQQKSKKYSDKQIRNIFKKCVFEIWNNKAIYDKLQVETNSDTNELYLQHVIQETIRKYPITKIVPKICKETFSIEGTDVMIPKETEIIIAFSAICYDSDYFREPETFDPDRYENKNYDFLLKVITDDEFQHLKIILLRFLQEFATAVRKNGRNDYPNLDEYLRKIKINDNIVTHM